MWLWRKEGFPQHIPITLAMWTVRMKPSKWQHQLRWLIASLHLHAWQKAYLHFKIKMTLQAKWYCLPAYVAPFTLHAVQNIWGAFWGRALLVLHYVALKKGENAHCLQWETEVEIKPLVTLQLCFGPRGVWLYWREGRGIEWESLGCYIGVSRWIWRKNISGTNYFNCLL